jgi:hypothetical protein
VKRYFYILALLAVACSTPRTEHQRNEMVMHFLLRSPELPIEKANATLDSILRVEPDSAAFRFVANQIEQSLSNPASRFRRDELYRHLLKAKLNSMHYLTQEKTGFQGRLDLISQNNEGEQANNFPFHTPTGEGKNMHDIATDYTILFFYNPECPACKQMKAALYTDPVINGNIQFGKLTVLAMYVDADTSVWRKHLPEMPSQWVHGRDVGEHLYKDGVYDLRAIPSVYLLDRLKRVIIKDCQNESLIGEKLK